MSPAGGAEELTWLWRERARQDSPIKELVSKVIDLSNIWNSRVDKYKQLVAGSRKQREEMVEMQN